MSVKKKYTAEDKAKVAIEALKGNMGFYAQPPPM